MELYWLEDRDAGVPPGNEWLSAAEAALLEGLHVPKRRAEWRLGRWTAKRAIAARLRLADDPRSLAEIEVRPAASGAPEVFVGGKAARVALSLSHSRGVGFCALAVAGIEVGCDVEWVEPRSPAFLADYFTTREQCLVSNLPEKFQAKALTLFWSAKESALKLLRCGLRADTRSVSAISPELPLPDGTSWHPLAARHSERGMFYGWWRDTGDRIWTVLADPPPPPPISLAATGRKDGAAAAISA